VLSVALTNPPVIDDIQPRSWPAAATGSPRLTVSGQWLNRTRLRYVHYGDKYKTPVTFVYVTVA